MFLPSIIDDVECLLPLTKYDKKKGKDLMKHNIEKEWKNELESIMKIGYKIEIEALASLSFNYITGKFFYKIKILTKMKMCIFLNSFKRKFHSILRELYI